MAPSAASLRDDDPLMRAWQRNAYPARRPAPHDPSAQARLPLLDMVAAIIGFESAGRTKSAALGMVVLRERFEFIDPATLPEGERTWDEFTTKHFPFGLKRANALLGGMVHRGGALRCSGCGAQAKCPCSCGLPYLGEHRWAMTVQDDGKTVSALDRAEAAIVANPEKSNRAIAAEIGMGHHTVGRARRKMKDAAGDAPLDAPVARTGRDGRRYKVRPDADERDEPGDGRKGFLFRADAAWQLANMGPPDPPAEVDEDCCKLAEDAAASWTSVARTLREMKR